MSKVLREDWEYLFFNLSFDGFAKSKRSSDKIEQYGNDFLRQLSYLPIQNLSKEKNDLLYYDLNSYCNHRDLNSRLKQLSQNLDNVFEFEDATKAILFTVNKLMCSDIQKTRILTYFYERDNTFKDSVQEFLKSTRLFSPIEYMIIAKMDLLSKEKELPIPDFLLQRNCVDFNATIILNFDKYKTTVFKALASKYKTDDVISFLQKHKKAITGSIPCVSWLKENPKLGNVILEKNITPISGEFENTATFKSMFTVDLTERIHHVNIQENIQEFFTVLNKSLSMIKSGGVRIEGYAVKSSEYRIVLEYKSVFPSEDAPYYPKESFDNAKKECFDTINSFFNDYMIINELHEIMQDLKTKKIDIYSTEFVPRILSVYAMSNALKRESAIDNAMKKDLPSPDIDINDNNKSIQSFKI